MPSADRRLAPRRTPRQVRAELTRERILTAAAHVFADYGYAAGTTNRIARQAGVSIGSLYQYFPNKDAILAALMIRHIEWDEPDGAEQVDLSPGSLPALARMLVQDSVAHHRDDPRLLRIMIEEAAFSQDLLDAIDRHGRRRHAQVRDLLARHPDVRVSDLDAATELVVFTVEMNIHKLMAEPHRGPVESLQNELVDMVCRYLAGAAG